MYYRHEILCISKRRALQGLKSRELDMYIFISISSSKRGRRRSEGPESRLRRAEQSRRTKLPMLAAMYSAGRACARVLRTPMPSDRQRQQNGGACRLGRLNTCAWQISKHPQTAPRPQTAHPLCHLLASDPDPLICQHRGVRLYSAAV